jgi:hypothetical protein
VQELSNDTAAMPINIFFILWDLQRLCLLLKWRWLKFFSPARANDYFNRFCRNFPNLFFPFSALFPTFAVLSQKTSGCGT